MKTKNMIIGIDPGFSGAISFLREDTLIIKDLPITKLNKKKQIDACAFSNMIKIYRTLIKLAVIEDVHSMPGQGVVSTFTFGYNAGILYGVLASLSIPIIRVKPSVWKPALGLSSDKKRSIALAKKIFIDYQEYFKRQKDDGRAEAALLAHFVQRSF